jgi:lactoylglutathione lyase
LCCGDLIILKRTIFFFIAQHVRLQVKDLDASIEFYTRVLGLGLLEKQDHVDPNIKLAFLGLKDSKESLIELTSGYNPNLPTEGKVHHIAFGVDDIDAEIARVKDLQITFVDETVTTYQVVQSMCFSMAQMVSGLNFSNLNKEKECQANGCLAPFLKKLLIRHKPIWHIMMLRLEATCIISQQPAIS